MCVYLSLYIYIYIYIIRLADNFDACDLTYFQFRLFFREGLACPPRRIVLYTPEFTSVGVCRAATRALQFGRGVRTRRDYLSLPVGEAGGRFPACEVRPLAPRLGGQWANPR